MLKELNIKNFAIIDQLRVEFTAGLNVFTGETGAGKSIVVDALNLALGERASADLIRTGCQEAVVEAAFELNGRATKEIKDLLGEQGIEMEAGEDLIIRRVLAASGKNKVYINGSLANLATLSALGATLADIHGQHEHQSLLSLERQMEMLDSFGSLDALRETLFQAYRRLQDIRKELTELETGERDRAQREDMLRFQKNEIEASQLKPGEDEALASEQKLLANSEKIAGLSRAADEALYSADHAALSELKKAVTNLREIAAIDSRLAPVLELCEAGRAQIEEAAREVSAYAEKVEFDPDRLEQIGDRLDLIQKLKKKYGGTIDEIIAFGEKAAAELERMERSTEEIARLQKEVQTIKSGLTSQAQTLTKKRGSAARDLEKKVEAELTHLGMKKTVFTVKITQEAGRRYAGRPQARAARRRPGGVPDLSQPGRGAEAARQDRIRRRAFAHHAGAQDHPGRGRPHPDAGVRRGGRRHRRRGCRRGREKAEAGGGKAPGLLHHPSAADREHGRQPLRRVQVREKGPDEHRGQAAGQAGAGRRDRADARRQDHYRRDHHACRGDDRPGDGDSAESGG